MDRADVLQLFPRNALEASLRYMSLPRWPLNTFRSNYMVFVTGDPYVADSLHYLARRFRGFLRTECTICSIRHDDIVHVGALVRVRWEDNQWYAAQMCMACESRFSSPNIDPSTHSWCSRCRQWFRDSEQWYCSHLASRSLATRDQFSDLPCTTRGHHGW